MEQARVPRGCWERAAGLFSCPGCPLQPTLQVVGQPPWQKAAEGAKVRVGGRAGTSKPEALQDWPCHQGLARSGQTLHKCLPMNRGRHTGESEQFQETGGHRQTQQWPGDATQRGRFVHCHSLSSSQPAAALLLHDPASWSQITIQACNHPQPPVCTAPPQAVHTPWPTSPWTKR